MVEVHSITERNEERQQRQAIGQVLRCRHQLKAQGHRAQALIALERKPSDPGWLELCNEPGIILCWPGLFQLAVRAPRLVD